MGNIDRKKIKRIVQLRHFFKHIRVDRFTTAVELAKTVNYNTKITEKASESVVISEKRAKYIGLRDKYFHDHEKSDVASLFIDVAHLDRSKTTQNQAEIIYSKIKNHNQHFPMVNINGLVTNTDTDVEVAHKVYNDNTIRSETDASFFSTLGVVNV